MKLRFLGKVSEKDESPTLYDTDRDTYLVQGWRVKDIELIARLNLGTGETCVEVPRTLMGFLADSELDARDDGQTAPTCILTDRETYVIKGREVIDAEAIARMKIPAHETVVEVSKALRVAMKEEYAVADR